MQDELQQIIDCLDTSIPETIRILAAPGVPRNPLNLSCAVRSLSEERLSASSGRAPAWGLAPFCPCRGAPPLGAGHPLRSSALGELLRGCAKGKNGWWGSGESKSSARWVCQHFVWMGESRGEGLWCREAVGHRNPQVLWV